MNYTTQDLLLGKESEPVSEKKDSFYRCKTLSLNQVGSWIHLAPKLRHHLHLTVIIYFTREYMLLGTG